MAKVKSRILEVRNKHFFYSSVLNCAESILTFLILLTQAYSIMPLYVCLPVLIEATESFLIHCYQHYSGYCVNVYNGKVLKHCLLIDVEHLIRELLPKWKITQ